MKMKILLKNRENVYMQVSEWGIAEENIPFMPVLPSSSVDTLYFVCIKTTVCTSMYTNHCLHIHICYATLHNYSMYPF